MNYRSVVLVFFAAGFIWAQAGPTAAAPAVLTVSGDVPAAVTLKTEDLLAMPRQSAMVAAEGGAKVVYQGVPLRELLIKAGAPIGKLRGKSLTTYVIAKAHDGYQVVFSLAEIDPQFANEDILVADQRDGKPLPAGQGPLRLVCPNDKEGARSVRMLESLEVVRLVK